MEQDEKVNISLHQFYTRQLKNVFSDNDRPKSYLFFRLINSYKMLCDSFKNSGWKDNDKRLLVYYYSKGQFIRAFFDIAGLIKQSLKTFFSSYKKI